MNSIEEHIEDLRRQLNELATNIDNISDEQVIKLSQELDKLINVYMDRKEK